MTATAAGTSPVRLEALDCEQVEEDHDTVLLLQKSLWEYLGTVVELCDVTAEASVEGTSWLDTQTTIRLVADDCS